jgi:hypothetical protein
LKRRRPHRIRFVRYAIATATCLLFPTWVSIALIFLVQLNYVIAPRIPILHRF